MVVQPDNMRYIPSVMDKTAETLPSGNQLDPGFGGIEKAIAISLALHMMVLLLPHPALWLPPAGMAYRPGRPAAQWVTLPATPSRAKDVVAPAVAPDSATGPIQVAPTPAAGESDSSDRPPTNYRLTRDLTRPVQIVTDLSDAGEWSFDGLSGSALFRVIVGSDGAARYVEVLASTLPPKIEGAAAWKLYTATYRPGEVDGVAVAAESFIEMRLTAAAGADASGSR
jgi:hypothetical protein